jgi:hypothetical protein
MMITYVTLCYCFYWTIMDPQVWGGRQTEIKIIGVPPCALVFTLVQQLVVLLFLRLVCYFS